MGADLSLERSVDSATSMAGAEVDQIRTFALTIREPNPTLPLQDREGADPRELPEAAATRVTLYKTGG